MLTLICLDVDVGELCLILTWHGFITKLIEMLQPLRNCTQYAITLNTKKLKNIYKYNLSVKKTLTVVSSCPYRNKTGQNDMALKCILYCWIY